MKRAIKHKLLRYYSDVVGGRFMAKGGPYGSLLGGLRRNGYVRMPEKISGDLQEIISRKVVSALGDASKLNKIYLHCNGQSADILGTKSYLASDLLSEVDDARKFTNFISLKTPLLDCPEILNLTIRKDVAEVIQGYLGPRFAISGTNIRRSFVTSFEDAETNKWHVDGNAGKMVKLFTYLGAVEDDLDGPTEFIEGSHARKYLGWDKSYRLPDKELREHFPKESFKLFTGSVGDIRLADTTGIHRGLKTIRRDRIMITINFCTHQERPVKAVRNDLICDFNSPIVSEFIKSHPIQARFLKSFLK
jgi:hypothetical protein